MGTYKIAGVQTDIKLGDKAANLEMMKSRLDETTSNGAFITVFPECALTGYCVESFEEAFGLAETSNGDSIGAMSEKCRELSTYCLFGYIEKDEDKIFNGLILTGPDGLVATYRKIHLPALGLDQFTTPGDRPFEVNEIDGLKVGMMICYDGSFPESARCLSLKGADVLLLPTNWPPGAGCTADYIPNTRANENNVYFMSVNRIGTERHFEFIGKSKICHPGGEDIVFANHANFEIMYADIDPEIARQKHLVRVPKKHEIHRTKDRRPDMYGEIVLPLGD